MRHFSRLHPILLLKKQESLISEIHIYEERQPNGQWLKSIKFKLPIIEEDMEMSLDSDTHVDTVTVHRDGRMTFRFQGGTEIEA